MTTNTSGQPQSIIVVGAGIAGLTAAFRLQQKGFSVRVLEASNDVGGRMATLSKDGYRMDLAVAVFPVTYHCLMQLIQDAGLADQVMPVTDLAGVLRGGRLYRMRATSTLDALTTGLLSFGSKLKMINAMRDASRIGERLAWDNLSLAAEFDVESAEAYALRRLNQELLDYVVGPVCRAFFMSSPAEVSAVNFLFVLRYFVGVSFFNSGTGVDFLPRGLARQLDVSLNSPVTSVRETASGVEVVWSKTGEADRTDLVAGCVIALPAPQMAAIYPALDAERRELALNFKYAKAVGVHLGLSKRPAEPVSMLQIPASEHPDLVAILLDHNKAPGRAPQGKGLLSTVWKDSWNRRQWDRDDKDVVADAIAAVRSLFPELVADVDCTHVQRWQFGPDIPAPGLHRQMARFHQAGDPRSRIRLAGDYMSTASTNVSASSAEKAARELVNLLGA